MKRSIATPGYPRIVKLVWTSISIAAPRIRAARTTPSAMRLATFWRPSMIEP
jgi:hypothetical protein